MRTGKPICADLINRQALPSSKALTPPLPYIQQQQNSPHLSLLLFCQARPLLLEKLNKVLHCSFRKEKGKMSELQFKKAAHFVAKSPPKEVCCLSSVFLCVFFLRVAD